MFLAEIAVAKWLLAEQLPLTKATANLFLLFPVQGLSALGHQTSLTSSHFHFKVLPVHFKWKNEMGRRRSAGEEGRKGGSWGMLSLTGGVGLLGGAQVRCSWAFMQACFQAMTNTSEQVSHPVPCGSAMQICRPFLRTASFLSYVFLNFNKPLGACCPNGSRAGKGMRQEQNTNLLQRAATKTGKGLERFSYDVSVHA